MRKTERNMLGMAAAVLLTLTACSEEAALTQPSAPQNPPVADNSGNVYIRGDDFTWETDDSDDNGGEGGASSIGAVTRTQLTVDGNAARFSWTAGDLVGILPDVGAQVYFAIPAPEEGEEMTSLAAFDGGAWALKAESNYAAYYPFVKDFDLDRTAVPVSYTGQKQTGVTTDHLGAFDYQGARPSVTNANGGVTFDFDHVGALVLLRFTVPTAGTALNSVTLTAPDGTTPFITEGTYDLTSTEGFPIAATATSETMTVGLDYTTTVADEEVTLYFMSAPVDLSGTMLDVSVAYGEGESAEIIRLVADGKNLEAGKGYVLYAGEKETVDLSALTETYTINDSKYYEFTGTGSHGIKVASGNPRIVLNGASITVGESYDYDNIANAIDVVAENSETTVYVVGTNNLTSNCGAGIYVKSGSTVIVKSNSRDNVLTAQAGSDGAGIGSTGFDYSGTDAGCGNIYIENVTVEANGAGEMDYSPGIGGASSCGSISIKNATVTARGYGAGPQSAPAIGSFTTPDIIIENSTINAYRAGMANSSFSDWIGSLRGRDEIGTPGIHCGNGYIKNTTVNKYMYDMPYMKNIEEGSVTYDADGNPTEN